MGELLKALEPAIKKLKSENQKEILEGIAELSRQNDKRLLQLAALYIIPLLNNEDSVVRMQAMSALGAIGPDAVSGLNEALVSDDKTLKTNAANTLYNIIKKHGRQGVKVQVGALLELLKDPDMQVVKAAVKLLGETGGRTVIPFLEKLKNADLVKNDVDEAIKKIEEREPSLEEKLKILKERIKDTEQTIKQPPRATPTPAKKK
ncbi:MAG: HEAT repeat domain-containing protein [Candidatus Micrarchaeia archaeon]